MASEKPFLSFVIDEDLLREIDNFWHDNHFQSRAATVKWLLAWALQQKPRPNK